MEVVGN